MRQLDLSLDAQRIDDGDAAQLAARSDQIDGLARDVLPGLRDIAALGQQP